MEVSLACGGGQQLKARKNKMAQGSLENKWKLFINIWGAILVTVRDFKANVDNALENKDTIKGNKEIKEMMDAQIIVDKVIGAKRNAIIRLNKK